MSKVGLFVALGALGALGEPAPSVRTRSTGKGGGHHGTSRKRQYRGRTKRRRASLPPLK